jgi:hypothetical protein
MILKIKLSCLVSRRQREYRDTYGKVLIHVIGEGAWKAGNLGKVFMQQHKCPEALFSVYNKRSKTIIIC